MSPLFKELAIVLVLKLALILGLWAAFFSERPPMTDGLVGLRLVDVPIRLDVQPPITNSEGNH